MTKNVLIVHHVEAGYDGQSDFSMFQWLAKAAETFHGKHYDLVIYNVSGVDWNYSNNDIIDEMNDQFRSYLSFLGDRFIEEDLKFGYDLDEVIDMLDLNGDDEDIFFSDSENIGSVIELNDCNSEAWPVPSWTPEIFGDVTINICGIFDYECVQELRSFLCAVNVDYSELYDLVM